MSEEEKYTKKENARLKLQQALQEFLKASAEFGQDDYEATSDLEDCLSNCNKKWNVVP